ncbi:unnamed protein product [Lactuca virosa]|uniref:Uncharacterized protein n=1 Tax=Lactuca virosa TaxID=75947 RepID=A0AAU9P3A1_9ASTR|nr:unnamed protein product [Lactuca virosa]
MDRKVSLYADTSLDRPSTPAPPRRPSAYSSAASALRLQLRRSSLRLQLRRLGPTPCSPRYFLIRNL